jgi:2-haloacid dehalogenase
VCTALWNAEQDRGRPIGDAVAERVARFPEHAALIAAYYERFDEMIPGAIEPMVALLTRLDEAGVPLYALTNWSAETFTVAERRFGFLHRFREIVVSGRIRLIKPDPRVFRHLLRVCDASPGDMLFIDDSRINVDTARALGFHVVHHVDPDETAAAVQRFGLLT